MTSNVRISGTTRLLFLETALATTAAQRRRAAILLRQYPDLTADVDLLKLLIYYPLIGPPIPDPKLAPEEVARQYIYAALEQRGWSGIQRVHREAHFQSTVTQQKFIVDYVLYVLVARLNKYFPVAFIEAKPLSSVPADGLPQAKKYADHYPNNASIRFVFSTNGRHYVRYDRWTTRTHKAKLLARFPTPYALAKSIGS